MDSKRYGFTVLVLVLFAAACSDNDETNLLRTQVAALETQVSWTPAFIPPNPTSGATATLIPSEASPTATLTLAPIPSTETPDRMPPPTPSTQEPSPTATATGGVRCRGIVAGWENVTKFSYELTVLLDEGGTLVVNGSGGYGGPAGVDWPFGCSR